MSWGGGEVRKPLCRSGSGRKVGSERCDSMIRVISYTEQLCGSGEEVMKKFLVTTWLEGKVMGRSLSDHVVMKGKTKIVLGSV
jgi:hypothetical protein